MSPDDRISADTESYFSLRHSPPIATTAAFHGGYFGGYYGGGYGRRYGGFYAGYFRDPDGNKLNAFVMG